LLQHTDYRIRFALRKRSADGSAENDGHENGGPSKCPGMNL